MAARVLILGGGFAGLEAARHLTRFRGTCDISIELVNRHRWSLFLPLLPDLISGRIDPNHITYPLEPFCRKRGIRFIHSEVKSIDLAAKSVRITEGRLTADFIIICLGCETNYHGRDDFQPHAPGLKTLVEAIDIRIHARRLLDMSSETERRTSHILVCGGGYTGFETASQLALYLSQIARLPFLKLQRRVRITILEEEDRVLGGTTPNVQNWAIKLSGRFGVDVRLNCSVRGFPSPGRVELTDGTICSDAMVVWTAGVTPGKECTELDAARTHGNRLQVDRHMRLPANPDIFAAGDVAGPVMPGPSRPIRMSVQFSLMAARCAAENVLRAIRNCEPQVYKPIDLGYVVPLGPGQAMGVVLGREMHGRVPFLLHYFMSIYRSRGLANHVGVMKDLFRELLPYPESDAKQQRTDSIHKPFKWANN